MNVGIYHSLWGGVNGGTRYLGSIAETLAKNHSVEIVHHCPDFDRQAVSEAIELDFSRIGFRYTPRPDRPPHSPGLFAKYQSEKNWCAELSRPYDLFINICSQAPIFCHARAGVLVTYFPTTQFEEFHGHLSPEWKQRPAILKMLYNCYHRFEWKRRFSTYDLVIAVSDYSKKWLRTIWNREATVVYPSIRDSFVPARKEPLIISIGAFRESQEKKHDFLIHAFKAVCDSGLSNWQLALVGTMRQTDENVAYMNRLKELAAGYPVSFHPNATAAELRALIERASALWHGMGYGVDPQKNPELLEHFGIVAIEAMSTGCIPLVFNGGGLPESVIHAENGYLWSTLDELSAYTTKLANEDSLRAKLAQSAINRAQEFSKDRFESRLLEVLSPLLK